MVTCPKCKSENTAEFGANEPNVRLGLAKKYQAYDCKDCGCFFRIPIVDKNEDKKP